MRFQWLRQLLDSTPQTSAKAARRGRRRARSGRPRFRPMAELLEDRLAPAVIMWDGGPAGTGTTWNTAANWVGDQLPGTVDGAADEAVIGAAFAGITITSTGNVTINRVTSAAALQVTAGTFSLAAASSITNNFSLSDATLTGAGNLTVSGLTTWTRGTMSGTGVTTIAAGGLLNIGSGSTKTLDGRRLDNRGTATWTDTGLLSIGNGSILNNLAGATFDIQNDASIFGFGSPGSISNAGTMRKTASTGSSFIGVPLNNTGALQVQSGTVSLASGGSSSGSLSVTAGANLNYVGGTFTLLAGASGTGPIQVNGATLDVPANVSLTALTLSDGMLQGAGILTVGSLTWTGGTMAGAGRTTASSSLTIGGVATKTLDGRRLDNMGTATWSNTGLLSVGNGAVLNNLAGATFDLQSDASMFDFGTPASFNNAGIFRKTTATGTSVIGVPLNNTNMLQVQSGTVNLARSGSSSGSLGASAGASLNFVSGTFTLQAGASGTGPMQINSATLDVAANVSLTTLTLTDGMLQGPGILTVGSLTWTGGTMAGAGRTIVSSSLAIGSGSSKMLDGRRLDHAGTATWTGTGNLNIGNGGNLNVLAGATFNIQNDAPIAGFGTPGSISNAGMMRKTTGAGTTFVSVPFNNADTLQVQTGIVNLVAGGSSSGVFLASAGATLTFNGGIHTLQAGATGIGGVQINGATVNLMGHVSFDNLTLTNGELSGVGDLTVGSLIWNGGTMGGTGKTVVTGTLTMGGLSTKTLDARRLDNAGMATWSGTGVFSVGNGGTLNNLAGATFDIQNDAFLFPFGTPGSISNAGTMRKSTGSGVTFISVAFSNAGTLAVQTGTVHLAGPFTNFSGTALTGGTYVVTGTFKFNLADIRTNAAAIVLDGPASQILNVDNVNGLANFATNAAGGSFSLRNGRSFTTAGAFSSAGSLSLGLNQFTVSGAYTQTATGSLSLEISGPPASGQFGKLAVSGTATLNGALNISLVNGFGPTIGQSFPIVTAGSRTGTFTTVNGLRLGRVQVFAPNYAPTSVTLEAIASAADLAVQTITIPTSATPGLNITITYTVRNQTTTPALGSWLDSIYLSADGTLSGNDLLLGRVTHSGDVAGMATYSEMLTVPLPGTVDGNYRILVVADSRGLVPDSNRPNNTVASMGTVPVTTPALTLGTPVSGTLAEGQSAYFKVVLPANETLVVTFDSASTTAFNELYVSRSQAPNRSQFDFGFTSPFEPDQQILIPTTQSATYYLLLYGDRVPGGSASFSLVAQTVPFGLTSIDQKAVGNGGPATLQIRGARLHTITSLRLNGPAGASILGTIVQAADNTIIYATFNLAGAPLGTYNLVAVSSGGPTATLTGALEVEAARRAELAVSFSMPTFFRAQDAFIATVQFSNPTNNDMLAPLLFFNTNGAADLGLAPTNLVGAAMPFLTRSPDGPRGILRPGRSDTLVVYGKFRPGFVSPFQIDVSVVTDSDHPVNFSRIQSAANYMAAFGTGTDLFLALLRNMVGATNRDSLRNLHETITPSGDVRDLRLGQLAALSTIVNLAGHTDGGVAFEVFHQGTSGRVRYVSAGFIASREYDANHWARQMAAEMRRRCPTDTIILVTWDSGSGTELALLTGAAGLTAASPASALLNAGVEAWNYYEAAAARTSAVGKAIADHIRSNGTDPAKVMLYGHSLGAQIMGFAGQELGGEVGKITAFDPAGPSFQGHRSERLDPTDGQLVEAIHTSQVFGTYRDVGDVNYYPVVDTINPVAAHGRSYELYLDMLRGSTGCDDPPIPSTSRPPNWIDDAVDLLSNPDYYILDQLVRKIGSIVFSLDPNEIVGPAGFGAGRFVMAGQSMPYTIHFENSASATAPAQVVRVTQTLDADLDFRTFELGSFGFGDVVVNVPNGRTVYSTRLDLRSSRGIFVDVTAGLDVTTGVATWTFTSLDPVTLDLPADPFAGFLPPNNISPEGQGFVTYTVRPRTTLGTGARIDAQARIFFDDNAPIDTSPIFNTIDAGIPSSSVTALSSMTVGPNFLVRWSGQDDTGGSGVASYDIYVSDNGSAFTRWLANTPLTQAVFPGQISHTYAFYSVARDNVGHLEAAPGAADTQTLVIAGTLRVAALTPTSTGFTVEFTQALDPASLNLYDTQTAGLGAADVTLTGSTTGAVRGSLVVNAAAGFTFIRTGGVLLADTYTVTLLSGSTGFRTPSAAQLDGNSDGTAGDNFTTTFMVASSTAVTVGVPDFMRGPGQPVDVPATSTSNDLPLRLSNGNGITSVNVTLVYNPSLLTITGATLGLGVPSGSVVTLNTSTPGTARLIFGSPTPLATGAIDFVRLTAQVPNGASYTTKHLLDITSVVINGGAIAGRDDDGLHIVGYFGDTTGNAGYSSADATRALRVAVGLDSGFSAYQLADPAIIADITGNGVLNSTDATRILQEFLGIDQAQIPPLPMSPPTIIPGGPDPLLQFPKTFRARPGESVTVPLLLDLSDGLESADLAISYDVQRLEVVEVRRGSLTGDFDLFSFNLDAQAGILRVGVGRTSGPISGRGSGSILEITFRLRPDAPPGKAIINLRRDQGLTTTQLNEGGLDLNPDPTNEAGDMLDGVITVGTQRERVLARDLLFASAASGRHTQKAGIDLIREVLAQSDVFRKRRSR